MYDFWNIPSFFFKNYLVDIFYKKKIYLMSKLVNCDYFRQQNSFIVFFYTI